MPISIPKSEANAMIRSLATSEKSRRSFKIAMTIFSVAVLSLCTAAATIALMPDIMKAINP